MAIPRETEGSGYYAEQAGLVTYEADWFSGAQIQLMMGDVLIDNAVAISYAVSANRTPVYGFGSEYFSFAVKAPILISGAMTIAFKESLYMLVPAARFHNNIVQGLLATARFSDGRAGGFASLETASGAARPGRVKYTNVEDLFGYVRQNTAEEGELSSTLVTQLGALDDSTWEHMAEKFEDAIWYGSDHQSPDARDLLFSNTMSNDVGEVDELAVLSHRRLDQYPPVDIWITYGDMEAPDQVNHTVQKLLDVYFTGESQEIVIGGEPVLQTFQFIARNRV
jgi:hypothetical protein